MYPVKPVNIVLIKLTLLMLPILLVQTACNPVEQNTNATQTGTAVGLLPLFSELDTLIIEQDTILFTPTEPVKIKEYLWSTVFNEDSITHRDDSGYVFNLQNGQQLFLNNVDEGDADEYKQYDEYSDMKKINHWLLHVSHYEWSTYELVNKHDGNVTEIIDYPVVSPNHDKIIITKQDLESGLEFNGIEFLRIRNKKVEQVWMRELVEIGLSEARWVDNNNVVFKRVNAKTHKTDYVKASFK